MRVAIAVLAASAAVALGSMVATAAPEAVTSPASAERAQYCPPKELQRRVRVLRAYTRKMPAAKRRYYRFVKSRRQRAVFLRKQKAQQNALLRAVLRCA
jgi:hypothetical protein